MASTHSQRGVREVTEVQSGTFILRERWAVPDRMGGVGQRASLGTQTVETGTHGEARCATPRKTVYKEEEERCFGR